MIQRPRGTRDFGPEEMVERRYLESIMEDEAEKFGFREISTPIFEHTELFTLKSGPAIVEEIYAFKDKGGREVSLRPELTAPVVRFFVNELNALPKPLKVYYRGPCFRYERPQSGRYREFYQFGAELMGSDHPEADAEVVALAASIIDSVGLQEKIIRLGHIGIFRKLLAEMGLDEEQISSVLHHLDKKEFEEVRSLLSVHTEGTGEIDEIIEIAQTRGGEEVLEDLEGEAISHLREVLRVLDSYDIEGVEVDLGVVRGLDYYTGMVFEIDAPKLGAEKQVCGGGSYSLAEIFGGEGICSTGFAIGFDRVYLALQEEGFEIPTSKVDVFVLPVHDSLRWIAFSLASTLRRAGMATEVDLMRRSISKGLKHADSLGARYTVIVGEQELEEDSVTVRNMNSGDQTLVKIEEIRNFLEKELGEGRESDSVQ